MSEQLTFNLNLDASPMIKSANQATALLEQKFKQAGNNIRNDLQKPIAIQAEFNLEGDPRRKYQEIVDRQRLVKQEQADINRRTKEQKTLQDTVNRALKSSTAEKKAALKQIDAIMRTTKKGSAEMKILAQYAKDLKNSLPKDSDIPNGNKLGGLTTSLTKANLAATAIMKALQLVSQAIKAVVQTGLQMQQLNLQMEAFAGGAAEAEKAMARFKDIAAKTPLDVMQVAEAGKIMMAFGVEADRAADSTEQLAIVAGATGGDINLLARNLGQVSAQGRAYTRDLTQFAIQGIPIWSELSEVTGNSVAELKKMATEGKIGMTEVTLALQNMTKEGSAFAAIAARMQETYAGKLAKLQSDFQATSGKIVQSINTIDNSLGDVSGRFGNFLGEMMTDFAEFMENAARLAEEKNFFDALYPEDHNQFGRFLEDMGESIDNFMKELLPIELAVTNAINSVNEAGKNTAGQFNVAKQVASDLEMSLQGLLGKMMKISTTPVGKQLVEDFKAAVKEAGAMEEGLNAQIKKLMEMAGVSDEKVRRIIDGYEKEKAAADATLNETIKKYKSLESSATSAWKAAKDAADAAIASNNDAIAGLEAQKQALNKLGPAGRELEKIRKQELEYTAETGKELKGHVTEEEKKKLQARASLEQMKAQKKTQQLQKEIQIKQLENEKLKKGLLEEEKRYNDEILDIEKDRKTAVENQNKAIEDMNGTLNKLNDILSGNLVNAWDQIDELIFDATKETKEVTTETWLMQDAIDAAYTEYSNILATVQDIATEIRNMPAIPVRSSSSGGSSGGGGGGTGFDSNFAGGPIAAGTTSWVNELGKEAFLSASGHLSMINDRQGKWTAPTDGTIIPAHLTKKLDVPTGGININKGAGRGASVGAAVKVIQASGGDVFHQNVTVQANNPVQAANNMMVEMTRLKRRRFR